MINRIRKQVWKQSVYWIAGAMIFMAAACAVQPRIPPGLNPEVKIPQVAVEPRNVRLGIATLIKTPITVAGVGFEPGDAVFVDLMGGPEQTPVNIPIDAGDVDEKGRFSIEFGKEVKALEMLRLDIDPSDIKPIIARAPLAPGVYVIRAYSVTNDQAAQCEIRLESPGFWDRFKDRIGILLGKIKVREGM